MSNIKLIKNGFLQGKEIDIEGLWKDISGSSWMFAKGNPTCLEYAVRSAANKLPIDDKVYYGKIDGLGYLVHESEV